MFGIREGRDLDFLHNADVDSDFDNPLLSSHNKELEDYTTNLDNILQPNESLLWNNIKFANWMRLLKWKRSEERKRIFGMLPHFVKFETVDNDTNNNSRFRTGSTRFAWICKTESSRQVLGAWEGSTESLQTKNILRVRRL